MLVRGTRRIERALCGSQAHSRSVDVVRVTCRHEEAELEQPLGEARAHLRRGALVGDARNGEVQRRELVGGRAAHDLTDGSVERRDGVAVRHEQRQLGSLQDRCELRVRGLHAAEAPAQRVRRGELVGGGLQPHVEARERLGRHAPLLHHVAVGALEEHACVDARDLANERLVAALHDAELIAPRLPRHVDGGERDDAVVSDSSTSKMPKPASPCSTNHTTRSPRPSMMDAQLGGGGSANGPSTRNTRGGTTVGAAPRVRRTWSALRAAFASTLSGEPPSRSRRCASRRSVSSAMSCARSSAESAVGRSATSSFTKARRPGGRSFTQRA